MSVWRSSSRVLFNHNCKLESAFHGWSSSLHTPTQSSYYQTNPFHNFPLPFRRIGAAGAVDDYTWQIGWIGFLYSVWCGSWSIECKSQWGNKSFPLANRKRFPWLCLSICSPHLPPIPRVYCGFVFFAACNSSPLHTYYCQFRQNSSTPRYLLACCCCCPAPLNGPGRDFYDSNPCRNLFIEPQGQSSSSRSGGGANELRILKAVCMWRLTLFHGQLMKGFLVMEITSTPRLFFS